MKHYTIIATGSFTSHPQDWFGSTVWDSMNIEEVRKNDLDFETMQTPEDSSYLIMPNFDWDTVTEILESYANGTISELEIPEDKVQDLVDFMQNHIQELSK
jgi:hypothetical protein